MPVPLRTYGLNKTTSLQDWGKLDWNEPIQVTITSKIAHSVKMAAFVFEQYKAKW